jgi:hypothetical protein
MKHTKPSSISKDSFKRSMLSSFPSVYLTTISIIQGVALGILAQQTFSGVHGNLRETFPFALASLVTIMVISYEYTWFVGMFRWPPRVWDTLVPFLLGFAEAAPMFFLRDAKMWWLWTAVFCIVGALAFVNTLSRCRSSMFKPHRACRVVREELVGNIALCLAWAAMLLLKYAIHPTQTTISVNDRLLLIPFMGTAVVIFYKGERFKDDLDDVLHSLPSAANGENTH